MRFGWNFLNLVRWVKKEKEVRVHVVEFADFVDPSRATAVLEATLPREEFLNRPEVWRWNGSGHGVNHKNAYVLLKTGEDIVTPNQILSGRESDPGILFELANEDVLFDVSDGKYVRDFRFDSDFQDLETFKPTFTGKSARERYIWYSKVVDVGQAAGALGQNKALLIVSRYWGVIFFVFSILASAIILFLL